MRHKAPHKAPRPIGREHVDAPPYPSLHEVKLNVPASLTSIMFEMPAFQLAFYIVNVLGYVRGRASLLMQKPQVTASPLFKLSGN